MDLNTTEIIVALGFIVTGLNYILPEKIVKKLRLDSFQRFLGFLAKTPGGIKTK